MHMRPDGTFERTDIWREGDWLDLWSVVHFLSGGTIALALLALDFDASAATIIAFLLMVMYELWEALVGIEETRANRVMDVVVGMASFVPTFFMLAPLLPAEQVASIFWLVLAVTLVLSAFGWRASRKAAVLERKLRMEYLSQRARMKDRFTWGAARKRAEFGDEDHSVSV